LDYADQRYYASSFGRFTTPDPYIASGGPADPQSWNRYTRGDPVNRLDRRGTCDTEEDEDEDCDDEPGEESSGQKAQTQINPKQDEVPVSVVRRKQKVKKNGSLTNKFRDMLKSAISGLASDCQKFFNSLSGGLDALKTSAGEIEFFDGMTASGEGAQRGSDVLEGASSNSLYQIVGGDAAILIVNALGTSNGVIIGSLFQDLGSMQGVTLVHEDAHYAYQMTDRQFGDAVKALNFDPSKYGMTNVNGNSQLFTAFLSKGCPGAK
jgi:hypothetical protein